MAEGEDGQVVVDVVQLQTRMVVKLQAGIRGVGCRLALAVIQLPPGEHDLMGDLRVDEEQSLVRRHQLLTVDTFEQSPLIDLFLIKPLKYPRYMLPSFSGIKTCFSKS